MTRSIVLTLLIINCITSLKIPNKKSEFDITDATYDDECGDRHNHKCYKNLEFYTGGKIPVWVYYNFTTNKNEFLHLNIEVMRSYMGDKFALVLVNATNERQLIPDLSDVPEFLRIPDHGARSDFLRAALLAHHGGVYLDADVLLQQSLDVTFGQRLTTNDFVAYTSGSQECDKHDFSSNAMAARKGTKLFVEWWKEAKRQMTQKCEFDEEDDPKNGVCCYDPDGMPRRCHVNWGGLGEIIGHEKLRIIQEDQKEEEYFKVSCLNEKDNLGLAPESAGGKIYWYHLTAPPLSGNWTKCVAESCPCWEPHGEPAGDLQCADGHFATNFFGRPGHHMFLSINSGAEFIQREEMIIGKWVASRLFRKALGLIEPSPQPFKIDANYHPSLMRVFPETQRLLV